MRENTFSSLDELLRYAAEQVLGTAPRDFPRAIGNIPTALPGCVEFERALRHGLLRWPYVEVERDRVRLPPPAYTASRNVTGRSMAGYVDPERVGRLLADPGVIVTVNDPGRWERGLRVTEQMHDDRVRASLTLRYSSGHVHDVAKRSPEHVATIAITRIPGEPRSECVLHSTTSTTTLESDSFVGLVELHVPSLSTLMRSVGDEALQSRPALTEHYHGLEPQQRREEVLRVLIEGGDGR